MAELINLRILSNVVYFVGRALGGNFTPIFLSSLFLYQGEDSIDSLTTRAVTYIS